MRDTPSPGASSGSTLPMLLSPTRQSKLEAIMRGGDIDAAHVTTQVGFQSSEPMERGVKRSLNSDIASSPVDIAGDDDVGPPLLDDRMGNRTAQKHKKIPKKQPWPTRGQSSVPEKVNSANTSASSQGNSANLITKFFPRKSRRSSTNENASDTNIQRNIIERRVRELDERESIIVQREKEVEQLRVTGVQEAKGAVKRLSQELASVTTAFIQHKKKSAELVIDLLRRIADFESREIAQIVLQDNEAIGQLVPTRQGHMIVDEWADGHAMKDLQRRMKENQEERARAEKDRRALLKERSMAGKHGQSVSKDQAIEAAEKEEIAKLRLSILKNDLQTLHMEELDLEYRKKQHVRRSRLLEQERNSPYNNHPLLNERYLALGLIGKGGFSEVYKAYDLFESRYVACKFHRLNKSWSRERKQNYTRHATREYEIHKKLDHERIIKLFDVFALDDTCFATILEYCDGKDLDVYLQKVSVVPEKAARSIMTQLFRGLMYLNQQSPRIIHYDLKPGNILFQRGELKIADFGLAKNMEDDNSGGMELTTPGYGTFWYLPPEVFPTGKEPAMINTKVDVWSAGIIFFQLLYGKRPFGHNQTPQLLLSEGTIANAKSVNFPIKPVISDATKSFISRCLAHSPTERPDILTIFEDPYFAVLLPETK